MKIGDFIDYSAIAKIQAIIAQAPDLVTKFEIDNKFETMDFVSIGYSLPDNTKIEIRVQIPKGKTV